MPNEKESKLKTISIHLNVVLFLSLLSGAAGTPTFPWACLACSHGHHLLCTRVGTDSFRGHWGWPLPSVNLWSSPAPLWKCPCSLYFPYMDSQVFYCLRLKLVIYGFPPKANLGPKCCPVIFPPWGFLILFHAPWWFRFLPTQLVNSYSLFLTLWMTSLLALQGGKR